jgi:hypothetical protein
MMIFIFINAKLHFLILIQKNVQLRINADFNYFLEGKARYDRNFQTIKPQKAIAK